MSLKRELGQLGAMMVGLGSIPGTGVIVSVKMAAVCRPHQPLAQSEAVYYSAWH